MRMRDPMRLTYIRHLSLSLVISHLLRALSRLLSVSGLLRPHHGQVVVRGQMFSSVGQKSDRSVCQSWVVRSVKGLCRSVGQSLGLINC